MNPSKYPIETIIQILSEAELPDSFLASVCRKYSISRTTFDKWKNLKDSLPMKLYALNRPKTEHSKNLKNSL